MQSVNRNRVRRVTARTGCRFIGLAIMLSIVAGCAAGRKPGPEPVAATTAAAAGPIVNRFEGGREGFSIREPADMDAATRSAFEKAVHMLENGSHAEAIEILVQVIERSPGVTAPHIDIAMAYRHIGQPEQAEKHLKKALSLVPEHPVASNEYGLLLRCSGRFAEARKVYEQSLIRFPEYLPVRKNLGILCDLYLSDPACALEQYRIYSEARHEDEEVKLWLADLSIRLGANQAEGL